jgi:hypothetical protein
MGLHALQVADPSSSMAQLACNMEEFEVLFHLGYIINAFKTPTRTSHRKSTTTTGSISRLVELL